MRRGSFMTATIFRILSMARLHQRSPPSAAVPQRRELRMKMHVPYPSHRHLFEAFSTRAEVVLTESSLAFNLRERLAELSRTHRLPIVGHRAQMADAGALFAYGASLDGQLRSAAQLVDKVLRGARPADLPVQQPNLFELVVNAATARSLDINLPTSFMLRADRVVA